MKLTGKTFGGATLTACDERKPDLFYMGLIDVSNLPSSCPKCKENDQNDGALSPSIIKPLKGPYFRYERRETELFFDLKQKYLKCPHCGSKILILDFQVLVEEISATLPPVKARKFSIKMMDLYLDSHEYAIEVLSILRGDFMLEAEPRNDYLKELEELIKAPRQSIR